MFAKLLAPMLIVAATAACVPQTSAPAVEAAASQTSAAVGTYKGLLPCADCSGIETSLTLNADGTFVLNELYLGSDKPFVTKGPYTMDKTGTVVTLIDKDDKGEHRSYKLGKNTITALKLDGTAVTGELAAMYVLTKAK